MKREKILDAVSFFGGIQYSFLKGMWALAKLQTPIVTVFAGRGSDEMKTGYSQQAFDLGVQLAERNFSIITGGGPGLMEEIVCGAASVVSKKELSKRTLGIGVAGVDQKFISNCSPIIFIRYFFIRKWLLTRYSHAFVILPGGIGTADEFFELLDLMRHAKIEQHPIILFGREYWKDLVSWYYDTAMKQGFISQKRHVPFIVVDDIQNVMELL